MKKISLIVFGLLLATLVSAKSMVEIWQTMPDSLIPYLDAKSKQEMVAPATMGLKAQVKHLLQGESSVDKLSSNYIHVLLNESAELQIKRLPYLGHDSIICVVKTWKAPELESEIHFFDQNWNVVDIPSPLHSKDRVSIVRPDSMNQTEFEDLSRSIEMVLISASLSENSNNITLLRTAPLFSKEEEKKVGLLLPPVVLEWNGREFQ